jgi:hypothetical protein
LNLDTGLLRNLQQTRHATFIETGELKRLIKLQVELACLMTDLELEEWLPAVPNSGGALS